MKPDFNRQLSIFSEHPQFTLANQGLIETWLNRIFMEENAAYSILNIIFLTDTELIKLNREYLNHDEFTDIISFQYSESPIEGELYISIDRVRENAIEYGQDFAREVSRVMVHGVLHLIGYQDKDDESRSEMQRLEDWYLTLLDNMVVNN